MLDVLISLAKATSEIGTPTEVCMYKSGLITLDGVTNDGKNFAVTFRLVDAGGERRC